jgi:hypothetical protein
MKNDELLGRGTVDGDHGNAGELLGRQQVGDVLGLGPLPSFIYIFIIMIIIKQV